MVTLLNFLAQILVHFSKTLEHQDHLVDLFSQCGAYLADLGIDITSPLASFDDRRIIG